MYWNWKEIDKIWNKLKVPHKYNNMRVSTELIANHDISMTLSVREDSGKTTNTMLFALCCWWWRNENLHIAYMRSDKAQITNEKVMNLFDVIIHNGYIERLTDGKYNNVIYKPMEHKFYMSNTYTDEDGHVLHEISPNYFCHCVCLENYLDYKSGLSDDILDFCIYDEFQDSKRQTTRQMVELMNNVSTFGRPLDRIDEKTGDPLFKLILLGNNTNKFSHWWSEFCIEKDIENLKFGGYIDKKTELGTTFCCQLLATSEEMKDKVRNKKIHFFGFNTPKMNAFNGLQEWQEECYQHLLYDEQIEDSVLLSDNIFIYHRNRYIRLYVYNNKNMGVFIFATYFNNSRFEDDIILTLSPTEKNHIYGFGDYTKRKLGSLLGIIRSNQIYFANNSVGSLFSNFMEEYRKNRYF